MNILLTNDDGIFAPGLRALAGTFSEAGHRVFVCAPDQERSAASHSATFGRPLQAREVPFDRAERAWATDGTPSDCAALGLFLAGRESPVDMVVSGINRGMNLGGACLYSGTVGAAMEASMSDFPALAVSLAVRWDDPVACRNTDYSAAAKLGCEPADFEQRKETYLKQLEGLRSGPVGDRIRAGMKISQL